METKITTSSVRVMLSFNFSNFEIALNLENENGISVDDINKARIDAQNLATTAVSDYKKSLANLNPAKEVKAIERKLSEIKDAINQEKPAPIEDPEEIAKVEALPLYTPPAKVEKIKKATRNYTKKAK